MTDNPKHRRRWLQFSLRTMLIVVTVFCIWMAIATKQARDQRQAVEMILEVGGRVKYDHENDQSGPPGPEWLRRLIGDEYFFSVTSVDLTGLDISDDSLAAVKRFTDLGWLHLNNTQITDAGLVHLKGLTNLQTLFLGNTQISDAGLEHLKGLTNIGLLYLRNSRVTEEGVKKIQRALPNCKIFRKAP